MADAKSFEAGRRTIAHHLVNIMTVVEPGHEIRLNAETVRRGGTPGRRSHTSMTPWALGFVPTVRIGAGAWQLCQACVQAATPVDHPHVTVFGINTSTTEGKGITWKMNK